MALSADLISQFVKVTKDTDKGSKESTVFGTVVDVDGSRYVRIDGSELLTPATSTVDVKDGEKVVVVISGHTARITGNVTSPAARTDDVKDVADRVGKFEKVITDKADIKDLNATNAKIETLVTENATINGRLNAAEGTIGDLKADNVAIKDKLTASEAEIGKLKVGKIDATEVKSTYATISNLNATNAQIEDLSAKQGNFENITTKNLEAVSGSIENLRTENATINGRLESNEADITSLKAENVEVKSLISGKASVSDLEASNARIEVLESNKIETDNLIAKKADIDLANVNNAWIQNGIIKDGSIGSAAIHDGAITNVKIADASIEAAKIKSINADVIDTGTIKTKRLIITGPDGQDSIVKAINLANGVSEADVNSQKIQAASIDVVDLSAFEAKIAGFDMSGYAIYSGKESIKDPKSGIYISTTGVGMGDGALTGKNESPLQAYADGSFKLIGKNSFFDFNAVTGDLNIELSSLKIASKSVATKDDIDEVRDEITTLLRIESSRGTVFKNDQVATVLSVVLYHGKQRITDSATMKEVFGSGAYLQWHWQRLDDESFGVLSSSDPRFGDEGFTFTLSPDDVDTKVTFMCELITE